MRRRATLSPTHPMVSYSVIFSLNTPGTRTDSLENTQKLLTARHGQHSRRAGQSMASPTGRVATRTHRRRWCP